MSGYLNNAGNILMLLFGAFALLQLLPAPVYGRPVAIAGSISPPSDSAADGATVGSLEVHEVSRRAGNEIYLWSMAAGQSVQMVEVQSENGTTQRYLEATAGDKSAAAALDLRFHSQNCIKLVETTSHLYVMIIPPAPVEVGNASASENGTDDAALNSTAASAPGTGSNGTRRGQLLIGDPAEYPNAISTFSYYPNGATTLSIKACEDGPNAEERSSITAPQTAEPANNCFIAFDSEGAAWPCNLPTDGDQLTRLQFHDGL